MDEAEIENVLLLYSFVNTVTWNSFLLPQTPCDIV